MDKYGIDSHKLNFHPRRVADWLDGKTIYPINLEVGLTGACNHRCIFCSIDYLNYKPDSLSKGMLLDNFTELASKGLKSILLAGNGEPLVHPCCTEIINETKKLGIDVALSTNAVLFDKNIITECLDSLSWVRFSVSAGTEKTFKLVQGAKDGDFDKVLTNIATAVEVKKAHNCKTVLNVQIVMIPENVDEIVTLAKEVKKCGADNFIVKSFGLTKLIKTSLKERVDEKFYADYEMLERDLLSMDSDEFHVIYRNQRIHNTFQKKPYSECYAAPFHACIGADGGVYPCCNLLGLSEYAYGNLNQNSFVEIWENKRRNDVLNKLKDCKLEPCPTACKLDVMNRYLHTLVHPGEHVNFI